MDGLGARLAAGAACLCLFVLLWGATLPALLSGLSLWALVLLIRRKTRDGRLKRKEKSLRRRIGGELALEELLLLPALRAHFETALLLSQRWPLTLLRTGEEGVLCAWGRHKALVRLCQLPPSDTVSPRDVMDFQRAVLEAEAEKGILCAPCGVSPAALSQARGTVPVSFLSRDALISLLGAARPATDRQLVALGQRKKQAPAAWLPLIFQPERALRYLGYGALLIGMYLLTGRFFYAVPGLICWGLSSVCRCVRPKEESLFP